MNTYEKMRRTNSKIRRWFVENGYRNIHFFPHTRWTKDYHFEGQDFDGICSKGNQLVLFQSKTNRKPTKKTQEKYAILGLRFNAQFLWLNWVDRKGLEVYGL